MKTMNIMAWLGTLLALGCACNNELVQYRTDDLKINIEKGDGWLHDFPLFMGINKKNPPQIAIWLEDGNGHYLSTVYVTHKIATQSWISAGKNRRKEALPHWCYSRGVRYADSLYLPTKESPFVDGMTGATPQGSFNVRLVPLSGLKQFTVKIEINHSTDFNEAFPKSAAPGNPNYSGGKMGSGQPALVYAASVDLTTGTKEFEALLVGHSSPDGSNGEVTPDVSKITTALHIVKRITISVQK